MSAPFVVPPGMNIHDNRQAELYSSSITTWVLAVLAVALRLWARRLMKSRYWLDDWFAILALVGRFGNQAHRVCAYLMVRFFPLVFLQAPLSVSHS